MQKAIELDGEVTRRERDIERERREREKERRERRGREGVGSCGVG
jgi:hypothetical protein